ncbi:MAG: hypothetical protein LBU65_08830 [Planctomycetaceae bacterium]|jgi:predicted DNA-binding transcriptional regulator YafY|nr:hypothetical protein [Planctomycetaceae bacterium]
MNEELEALAAELQKVRRWEQDTQNLPNAEKDVAFSAIPAYVPSDAVKQQNEAIVRYQKLSRNFSYGEY